MFCARCGTENPDDGKFCRSCGARIGLIDDASPDDDSSGTSKRRSRRERYASGSRKFIWGLVLLVAGLFLGAPLKGNEYWIFTLLPGMVLIVWSMADFIRLETGWDPGSGSTGDGVQPEDAETRALPPERTIFAEQEMKRGLDTGKFVSPSVTEDTTRDLESKAAAETRKLEND